MAGVLVSPGQFGRGCPQAAVPVLSECDETEARRGVNHQCFEVLREMQQDVNSFGGARGCVFRSLPKESGSRALTFLHSWIRGVGWQSPLYL